MLLHVTCRFCRYAVKEWRHDAMPLRRCCYADYIAACHAASAMLIRLLRYALFRHFADIVTRFSRR